MLSDSGVNGPSNQPIECSFLRYAWTTLGCSCADRRALGSVWLKPILDARNDIAGKCSV